MRNYLSIDIYIIMQSDDDKPVLARIGEAEFLASVLTAFSEFNLSSLTTRKTA
jgi:hypothetical protein